MGDCNLILVGHTASQEGLIVLLRSQYLSRCKLKVVNMSLVRKDRDDRGRA
jgi:hypothetical protein